MEDYKELRSDDNDPLFDKTNMLKKEFPSDFRQIRYFTLLIVQSAPSEIKELNLLEQQISEVIKNGVKHGNADHFIVTLTGDSAHLRLSVKDNGQSDFTDENSEAKIENGFGIKKIQSYVGRIGGKAEFSNDDGFRAAVELPLL